VIDFERVEPDLCPPELIADENGIRRFELCRNRYFVTERVAMVSGAIFKGECIGESLEVWGVIEGRAEINAMQLEAVRFALLPAALGDFTVRATTSATFLRTYVE